MFQTMDPPGSSAASADVAITSLDDVVSKLASERDESAVALCSAARTLQRGVQAEIRRLCTPWGVQLTEKKASGQRGRRADGVIKTELTAAFIEKASEHFRSIPVSIATEQLRATVLRVQAPATFINVPQLLQSTASSSAAGSVPQLLQSSASSSANPSTEYEANPASLSNYPNLFDPPSAAAIDLIKWAHAHATYPGVAAWLEACGQWDAAVATKDHVNQTKRRKLCKDHGPPLTDVMKKCHNRGGDGGSETKTLRAN